MDCTEPCPAVFKFYYPYELAHCSYILLVCRNPHSHANPTPTKTLQAIHDVLTSLLEELDLKLTDAMPRQIVLDSVFMSGLRKVLGWVNLCDPTLGDLHPSLSNADHTARIINTLQNQHYMFGTGLKGAYHLLYEHKKLPPEKRYVCCVEEHSVSSEGQIYIVVCMFKAMSQLLLQTRRPSIDTSFKCLHNWQEFEIEAWFPEYLCSIVVARAFTTSQSAEAHHILFNRIFLIVHKDTGEIVKFCHIHGVSFETFMADGHVGQALGLGLHCEEMCQNMAGYCVIEWSKALHALTPYEHLARFYCYCFTDFIRNVLALKGHVSLEACCNGFVREARRPLVRPTYLPIFLTVSQSLPSYWLKNKESASGFALAALYQPLSKIPIDIWKASPSTSNGNERAHCSINHDGIMCGMQYDSRAMSGIDLLCRYGIPSRDQPPTHFQRAARAISQASMVQKCTLQAHDIELQTIYWQLTGLQSNLRTQTASLKRAMETGKGIE
ncbi:hypothetical protein K439DRAFT_1614148 [Ramaria rubella]|nr:hypothetical protein K439DRAFT_1614148 [Ramaria rubella]